MTVFVPVVREFDSENCLSFQPLVSILIPCYNAGPWIAECIESALNQTYTNKEIIAVDDGSTDNSLEIIRGFGDRIQLETGPNRGGNAARNRLVELSRGEWLEFLDADDFLLPHKIENQIRLIQTRPEVDAVYSACLHKKNESPIQPDAAIIDEDLYANYIRWDYFTTTVLLLKKSAVIEVGGWNEQQPVCQEHELVLRMILAGKSFVLAPEALGVNRIQHTHSVSRRSPLNTLKHKMALSDYLETYLISTGNMTEVRRVALAQSRFVAARATYPWDPDLARQLCAKALATGPFVSPVGVNPVYTMLFRLLGFDAAEGIGKLRRKVKGFMANAAPRQ